MSKKVSLFLCTLLVLFGCGSGDEGENSEARKVQAPMTGVSLKASEVTDCGPIV